MATTTPKADTWFDADCGTYRHTAPAGYCFGGDLHEFVYHAEFGGGMRAAKRDFAKREKAEPLERCERKNCDWCNDPTPGKIPT